MLYTCPSKRIVSCTALFPFSPTAVYLRAAARRALSLEKGSGTLQPSPLRLAGGCFLAGLLPPTTWNPSQSNCFSQLQHLKIAALVSFKNSRHSACHYLLKMFLKVLLGHGRRGRSVWSISLFEEGDGASAAACAALPLSCPRFPQPSMCIRVFRVMYL